ncbi:MAG: response regulator [Chloroflexota bacterium]
MTTVLYIEDNPLNMRLVQKYLKKVGLTMIEAIDGSSGIEVATEQRPDLILVDINLPDIDGLEVTRNLKANPDMTNTPIVALTANAMHGDRERCLDAGCDAYLAKPIARQELYNTLRNYIPEAFAAAV